MALSVIMRPLPRYMITIEGTNWKDSQDVELPRLPGEGETIETKYGTCLVTHTDPLPDSQQYSGKILCRFPG